MKQVTIVTDSLACLPKEYVAQYKIGILPINFYCGGKVYRDWIDVTPSEAYQLFLKDPETFKSSAASPEDVIKVYRESSQQAKNILCITVSRKLSTTYNVALSATEIVKAELPGTRITVMDSYTATNAEGFVALAAARAAEEGKELPEVIKAAEAVQKKINCIFLLDTIRYVYRSGRLPKVAARAASMLNIRPILTVTSGLVRFNGAVRSRSHGIERLLNMMRDKVKDNPVHVSLAHAYALDEAEKLIGRIASEFHCAELWLTELSPLIGYACGTGTLGLAFYTESSPSSNPSLMSPD